MKYASFFLLLGGAQIYLAATSGWAGLLWLWSGVSFLLVSFAYFGLGSQVFGKHSDGTLALARKLLLLPYLLLTWSLRHVERLVSKENAFDEVSPGLYVGRRPLSHEVPSDVGLVIDLTCEFPASRGVTAGRHYVCCPTLDTDVPDAESLSTVLCRIASSEKAVLIHCASGHGRSALLAAATLLERGLAVSPADAEALLKRARPGIKLKPKQMQFLKRTFTT